MLHKLVSILILDTGHWTGLTTRKSTINLGLPTQTRVITLTRVEDILKDYYQTFSEIFCEEIPANIRSVGEFDDCYEEERCG